MKILEYNDVDPQMVCYLNILALDQPLTPEIAAKIRKSDPRSFDCLTVYAVERDELLGQVGIFRMPMVSIIGREDVGGIWLFALQPKLLGMGIGSLLLEEAHRRMLEAGLRFSAINTDRFHMAYEHYLRHGYEDTNVWATAMARWSTAHQPTRLRSELAGVDGYELIEEIHAKVGKEYLGFAWRHKPFAPIHKVNFPEIWVLRENSKPIGYAFTDHRDSVLTISSLLVKKGIEAAEAAAAVAAEQRADYIKVKISRPVEMTSLRQAGYHVAHPDRWSFMIKPLIPEATMEDARQLFGVGSDQFLISWLDVT